VDRLELAWAAGFFDGDGWAAAIGNRARRQPQARINQAGSVMPEVLIRFQAAVGGVGHLGGPYRKPGRQDLWWWIASSRPDVEYVYSQLAPWLCSIKTGQLQTALGLSLHDPAHSRGEELAWAAGFFDAEGSVCLLKHRSHDGYWLIEASVTQGCALGLPPELTRFRNAVGLGHMYGPMFQEGATEPIWRWKSSRLIDVRAVVELLDPWLGEVKRDQATRVISIVAGQATLPRGNPAWGSHKTHCVHGHAYDTARVRPYCGRGVGIQRRANKQCLACSREQARARRSAKSTTC